MKSQKRSRTEQARPYLYAWITEFSVAAPDSGDLLQDLEIGTKRIQRAHERRGGSESEFDHFVFATTGSADLTEVTFFNHIYHFFEIAESSSRSSRRSIGARCLTETELEQVETTCDEYKIVPISDLAREDPERPLMSVIYLRLSAAARLCVGTGSEWDPSSLTLIDEFLSRFFSSKKTERSSERKTVWALYDETLRANPGGKSARYVPIRITPLIGLDTVDIAFVVRARSLEQIAALTLVARHQRLGSLWPALDAHPDHVRRMKNLLGISIVSSDWNIAALFREVRTNWGLRVHWNADSKVGRLERAEDPERLIAAATVSLTLARVAPDRTMEPMASFGLVDTLRQKNKVEVSAKNHSLVLFGPFDTVLTPSSEELFRALSLSDIQSHFRQLTGIEFDGGSKMRKGIWPSTEIAVWVEIPEGWEYPEYVLMKEFRKLLHKRRERNFARVGRRSMIRQWLDGARKFGISYSTTNIMVNLLLGFMVYLERDPERFSELIPTIRYIIDSVTPSEPEVADAKGRQQPSQSEIRWMIARANEHFTALARTSFPLQTPITPFASATNTGHQLATEAFLCLADELAQNIAPGYKLLVLESAGGGLVCEPANLRLIALRVSPFVIHYPISWQIASELARCRLSSSSWEELPDREQRSFRKFLREGGVSPVAGADVSSCLADFGVALDSQATGSHSRVIVLPLTKILGDLVVDLLLWRSLCLKSDGVDEGFRRFWLIHGPRIVSAKRDLFGHMPPDISVTCQLTLRVFFSNYLISVASSARLRAGHDGETAFDWISSLVRLLGRLKDETFHLERKTVDLDFEGRSFVHLQCLKTDLGIPDEKWSVAMKLLGSGLNELQSERQWVLEIMDKWLNLSRRLVNFWLWRDTRESAVRKHYCAYLSKLLNEWETSDPWPPFIRHYGTGVESEGAEGRLDLLVPRHRKRASDPSGGFISLRGGVFLRGKGSAIHKRSAYDSNLEAQTDYHSKTGFLIKRLADRGRRIRFMHLESFLLRQ